VGGTLTAALNLALAAGAPISAGSRAATPFHIRGKHRGLDPGSFGRRHSWSALYLYPRRQESFGWPLSSERNGRLLAARLDDGCAVAWEHRGLRQRG